MLVNASIHVRKRLTATKTIGFGKQVLTSSVNSLSNWWVLKGLLRHIELRYSGSVRSWLRQLTARGKTGDTSVDARAAAA